ncbi:MAG: hypothetical protein IMZ61_06095, partial [Planctomycetes bacterium]|nr:hypothetical protein [Planctomycetota bacterium]
AVLILGALFWQRKTDRPAGVIDLSLATLSFTIASPVAWEHHYGITPDHLCSSTAVGD